MRRIDWALGCLLVVILLVMVGGGILYWQQTRLNEALTSVSAAGQPETELATTGTTALLAYGKALGKAQAWQADAKLVAASATWPLATTLAQIESGRENWLFTFYSPASGLAATISVVDGTAAVSESHLVEQPLTLLDASGWKLDTNEAIAVFNVNGGADFFQNQQDITFSMQLSTAGERMEWLIAAVSGSSGHSLTLWVDATSGEVLDIQAVP